MSHRCISIVYKVARETLKARLSVFWGNCIRLRALHEELFGEDKLRFRAYDQKPLWFNAAGGARTLAPLGLKVVSVRQNMHATRARCTERALAGTWPRGRGGATGAKNSYLINRSMN